VVGMASDSLAPTYGAFSLNIAVMAICLSAGTVALAVFARLAAHMERSGYIARVTGKD
jgi:hypothetical protein